MKTVLGELKSQIPIDWSRQYDSEPGLERNHDFLKKKSKTSIKSI